MIVLRDLNLPLSLIKKWLRIGGTIFCLAYIGFLLDLKQLTITLSNPSLPFLVACISLTPLFICCSVWKWHLLLRAQGINAQLNTLLRIYLVGLFFNQIFPTSIGGDFVRVYIAKKNSIPINVAVASVFVDRFIGLMSLLFFMIISWIIISIQTGDIRWIYAAAALCVASLTGLLGIMGISFKRIISNLPEGSLRKAISFLDEGHDAIRDYWKNPGCLVVPIALSFVFVFLCCLNYWFAALTFHPEVEIQTVFLIVPSIMFLGNLPVSIGGWGLQELSTAVVFDSAGLGASLGLSAAILLRAKNVILALFGGVCYLLPWKSITLRKKR